MDCGISNNIRLKNEGADVGIVAVDLFCGAGGLTCGLRKAQIQVAAGYDLDASCRYPFEENNEGVRFIEADISKVSGADLARHYPQGAIKLLAGCAPCQPFSKYRQGADTTQDKKWKLLYHFARLITEVEPELVTMENVPELTKHKVFDDFVHNLEKDYKVSFSVVNCSEYGVPQSRNRLILLASKLGPIKLPTPTHKGQQITVKDAIGALPSIGAGAGHPKDPLHASAGLSPVNLKRIRHSRPGGSWRDWPEDLVAECHRKGSGKTYPSVYGRMQWDEPAPTMTTQCYGFGNGRFGHPEQDRAISLREAAIFQSFPKHYKFVRPGDKVIFERVGRLIGNAVPPRLGEVIGRAFIKHLKEQELQ